MRAMSAVTLRAAPTTNVECGCGAHDPTQPDIDQPGRAVVVRLRMDLVSAACVCDRLEIYSHRKYVGLCALDTVAVPSSMTAGANT